MAGGIIDPGVPGTIDPTGDDILFREPVLSGSRIDATKPFDQARSDAGGQPIRVVIADDGSKHIMQGNHRVYGAQEDGVPSVGCLIYTPDQWQAFTGMPFLPRGTNNPRIDP
jgi:hypothetical protein